MTFERIAASCLLLSVAAACSQSPGVTAYPGLAGVVQSRHGALAPRAAGSVQYVYGGGTATAHWKAQGPSGACAGTITLNNNFIQFYVRADNGRLDTAIQTNVTITGPTKGKCGSKPIAKGTQYSEQLVLTSGDISHGEIHNLAGTSPVPGVAGSISITGPVCHPTVELGTYTIGTGLRIEKATLTGVKEQLPKNC